MTGWLIYHPKRCVSNFGSTRVYHDECKGNQDPYVWSESFLHTYCHITQMSPQEGDVEFWVSGDQWPDFNMLLCDLVFVIKNKVYWTEANRMEADDPLVDSPEAYNDHYRWWPDHRYKRRRRFTLKADPALSFQPQGGNGELPDLIPALERLGVSPSTVRSRLKAGFASRPMPLNSEVADGLKTWLQASAARRLSGSELRTLRLASPQLASP